MTIGVLVRSLGRQCGISEYGICLAQRLGGIAVRNAQELPTDCSSVFIQYEPSLYRGLPDLLNEISQVEGIPIIDVHTEIPPDIVPMLVSSLQSPAIVGVKRGPRPGTWFLPHISYALAKLPSTSPREIHLGSFGFAVPNKRYEDLIGLAIRLNVPLTILAAIANATPGIQVLSQGYIDYLRMMAHGRANIKINSSFLNHEQIIDELQKCSHLICTMENLDRTSGSMRMMALVNRPLISLPCAGSDEIGAIQVQSLSEVTIPFLQRKHPVPSFSDGLDEYHRLLEHLSRVYA